MKKSVTTLWSEGWVFTRQFHGFCEIWKKDKDLMLYNRMTETVYHIFKGE